MNLNQLPVLIRRDVPTAQLPAVYETAKKALAACVALDECKEWSDKAAALASYARQAKNIVLEDHAKRIRLRALERAGQLLLEIAPKRGGKHSHKGSRREALDNAALTRMEGSAAMRLAAASPAQRDSLIEGKSPPHSATRINYALPRRGEPSVKQFVASDIYKSVFGGVGKSPGLGLIRTITKRFPPTVARQFTLDESARIRPVLTEFAEWIDEFERNLPKVRK